MFDVDSTLSPELGSPRQSLNQSDPGRHCKHPKPLLIRIDLHTSLKPSQRHVQHTYKKTESKVFSRLAGIAAFLQDFGNLGCDLADLGLQGFRNTSVRAQFAFFLVVGFRV